MRRTIPAFLKLRLVPILATCAALVHLGASAGTPDATDLSSLSAPEFLRSIRRPFRQNAWGEATGTVHRVSNNREDIRGTLRVRVTFSPDSLHAQLVLNDTNTYGFQQEHGGRIPAITSIDLPEDETPPTLFDFGIAPEDLTFAFIYWDLRRELPRERFRRRECRVMELAHPTDGGSVRVWFSAVHGFPMKAQWYRKDQEKPWRSLELKGAKKHDGNLWFVKELRLSGDGWKTKVRFDHAEINPVEDRTAIPPADD